MSAGLDEDGWMGGGSGRLRGVKAKKKRSKRDSSRSSSLERALDVTVAKVSTMVIVMVMTGLECPGDASDVTLLSVYL